MASKRSAEPVGADEAQARSRPRTGPGGGGGGGSAAGGGGFDPASIGLPADFRLTDYAKLKG